MRAEKYIEEFKSLGIEIVPLPWTERDYREHLYDFFITGSPRKGVTYISLSLHGGIVVYVDGLESYFSLKGYGESIKNDIELMISLMKQKQWKLLVKDEYKAFVKAIPDSLTRLH